MTWRDRQTATYPPDVGVRYRLMDMPVASPERAQRARTRATRTTPLPGCAACSETEPCARHASFDLMASLGAAPRGPRSADEYVRWEPV